MARPKKKADPGAGHNSGDLSDEDFEALVLYYERKIGAAAAEVEIARAALKSKQQVVNDNFALVKAEIHYSRKEFEAFLAEKRFAAEDEEGYLEKLERERRLRQAGGLPVGAQMELLLPSTGDTADDKARAHGLGRRAFDAFKECAPPSEIDPMFHQDWIGGWQERQSETIQKMGRAEAILASRGEPQAQDPVNLGDEDGGEGEGGESAGEPEGIDVEATADALKASGWAGDGPEPAPETIVRNNGKTVRAVA